MLLTDVPAGWLRHTVALIIDFVALWGIPVEILQPWTEPISGVRLVIAKATLIGATRYLPVDARK